MIFDPDSREREARNNPDVQKGLEQARRGELTDGPKLDRRIEDRRLLVGGRRTDDVPSLTIPSVHPAEAAQLALSARIVEMVALASTIRQCQRTGHPDLSKHLEALLTKLGA